MGKKSHRPLIDWDAIGIVLIMVLCTPPGWIGLILIALIFSS